MKRRSLTTLLRVNQYELDQKRRQIADALRHYDRVEQARLDLTDEIRKEQAVAAELQRPGDYAAYAERAIGRRDDLDVRLQDADQKIVEAQDDAMETYREVKKFELLEAALETRERREELHRENNILDEIAIQRSGQDKSDI